MVPIFNIKKCKPAKDEETQTWNIFYKIIIEASEKLWMVLLTLNEFPQKVLLLVCFLNKFLHLAQNSAYHKLFQYIVYLLVYDFNLLTVNNHYFHQSGL